MLMKYHLSILYNLSWQEERVLRS